MAYRSGGLGILGTGVLRLLRGRGGRGLGCLGVGLGLQLGRRSGPRLGLSRRVDVLFRILLERVCEAHVCLSVVEVRLRSGALTHKGIRGMASPAGWPFTSRTW